MSDTTEAAGTAPDARAVLVVGTYDTKSDELDYLASVVRGQGGAVVTMDVGVLAGGPNRVDHSRHDVAAAADSTIEAIIAGDGEAQAMETMAAGAVALVARLHREGRFGGVIVLGGSMGTDLALDLCGALPLGVPKLIVSTVSFSPLIPPERVPADVQMMLWAGGLCGLNSQIVAPGCCDLVDLVGWQAVPVRFANHERHVHNRLITSVVLKEGERREVASAHTRKLAGATSPSAFLLPLAGVGEWDRVGAPLHRPVEHAVFCETFRAACPDTVELHVVDAHINDDTFTDKALEQFDAWLADGTVSMPDPSATADA